MKVEQRYYCLCNADCIHKNGEVVKVKIANDGAKIKVDACGNTSKKCYCKYRRNYENKKRAN